MGGTTDFDDFKTTESIYDKPEYNVWYNFIVAGIEGITVRKVPEWLERFVAPT